MKRIRPLIYIIVILAVIKLVFNLNLFSSLEHKAQDYMFKLRGVQAPSDQIVVVALDDETFNATQASWPFPRDMHAKLIDNLNAAGARQIIFDVEFTENSDPLADSILGATAAKYQNVIFSGKTIRNPDNPDHIQVLKPIDPLLENGVAWGLVNMPYDTDNYVRNYASFDKVVDEYYYPIGVASIGNLRLYQADWAKTIKPGFNTLRVTDKNIRLNNRNQTLINYRGPANTFPYVSYSSVIDDSLTVMPGYQGAEMDEFYQLQSEGVFQDKIVLVGMTIDEAHDKFPTPYGGELMPGVEIHANFIEMVLQNIYLRTINPWLFIIIELLLIIAAWFIFKLLKPQLAALLMLLLIVADLLVAFLLFRSQGLIIPVIQTALAFVLIYIVSLISHYIETQKEKRFIRNAFQQYMAPQLVEQLLKDKNSLKYGGSLQEISVLFSDIRSFTTYSENHKPEVTVQILKEYLTEMVNSIIANQGIVDKFVGDEIMALYGTPVPLENHALSACKTALDMRRRLTDLQNRWKAEGREIFEIGIGINTGQAVIGNLGSEQIFDFTAIGDTINLGARLEGINKEYDNPNHIIISEFTLEKVQDLVEVSYLDEVKVKGKNKAVKIYALLGLKQVMSNE